MGLTSRTTKKGSRYQSTDYGRAVKKLWENVAMPLREKTAREWGELKAVDVSEKTLCGNQKIMIAVSVGAAATTLIPKWPEWIESNGNAKLQNCTRVSVFEMKISGPVEALMKNKSEAKETGEKRER